MALEPAVAAYVRSVVDALHDALGDDLAGAWLVGSAALGDFDPARSDLDVQAVTVRRPVRRTLEALVGAVERLPCPVRGLELVVYAREDLTGPLGPSYALNLNTGPGMERHVAFDPAQDPRFWFVIDVSIARRHALVLHGAEAATVLPEPPRALVVAALREALDWYGGHGGSPGQTILGACRTWAWATDGRWRSKGESARWARGRLDDPGPVDRALAARDGGGAAPGAADVEAVLARARAALDGPQPKR
jgi:hypothetical protein